MIDVNQYFEKFILPEILENNFTMGVYMEDDEYEDYYSHAEIESAREKLKYLIINYLIKNYDGKYCVYEIDNIILMTTEEAKKKPFFHNDDIISKENYKMGDD